MGLRTVNMTFHTCQDNYKIEWISESQTLPRYITAYQPLITNEPLRKPLNFSSFPRYLLYLLVMGLDTSLRNRL